MPDTGNAGDFPAPPSPQPTGRKLVVFHDDADTATMQQTLTKRVGGRTRDRREFAGASFAASAALDTNETLFFHRQKVAIIPASETTQTKALAADDSVLLVRPEFFIFTIDDLRDRHAAWVREGLRILVEQYGAPPPGFAIRAVEALSAPTDYSDNTEFTWGLQATGVSETHLTGAGIKVAVLDTGIDLKHPDFDKRVPQLVTKSFIPNESVQDGRGHGTHTAGTIAGPARSAVGRRYGVAPDVELHVGKVLNDAGFGSEGQMLDGMNWAIDNKCEVISMSLGRATTTNEKPDPTYERTAKSALKEGCLIIAAAGNESARDFGYVAPVGSPAYLKSVMAVAAVDPSMKVAPFSCAGLSSTAGGQVDISGPGVSVYSAFPMPRQSRMLQGTSMACPHVSGIAALWAQSDPGLRGRALWDALIRAARPLGPPRDFGTGLVQCPPRPTKPLVTV